MISCIRYGNIFTISLSKCINIASHYTYVIYVTVNINTVAPPTMNIEYIFEFELKQTPVFRLANLYAGETGIC